MNLALTSEQIESARRSIASLREPARIRGEKYFREGKVSALDPYKSGTGFHAVVAGKADYRVRIRYVDGDWFCECSCPVAFDCEHCCGALLKAIDESAHAGSEQNADAVNAKFSTILSTRLDRKLTGDEQRAADAVDNLFKNFRTEEVIGEHLLNAITGRNGRSWDHVQVWPHEPDSPWEMWLFIAAFLRRKKWMCPQGLSAATDWSEVDALIAAGDR
jgi:uncharacterized Zn finger protein